MRVCRALPLVAVLLALPVQAHAQFGGMPGLPGSGVPGGMPGAGGFGAPAAPPPACKQLLALRDDTQKNADAISAASKRKATPQVACRLFKVFLASEIKLIKGIEEFGPQCGIPSNVPAQLKTGHTRAQHVAKQVCDAAAEGPRPAAPSLSDALGASPVMPDSTNKRGGGTFDTLSGSALAR